VLLLLLLLLVLLLLVGIGWRTAESLFFGLSDFGLVIASSLDAGGEEFELFSGRESLGVNVVEEDIANEEFLAEEGGRDFLEENGRVVGQDIEVRQLLIHSRQSVRVSLVVLLWSLRHWFCYRPKHKSNQSKVK